MTGNQKDWRWCKRCRKWVMAFSFGVGGWCGPCLIEWSESARHIAEAKEAASYLERDYAKEAL